MAKILIILHFLGFTAGIGFGAAGLIAGLRAARAEPPAAATLRQIQPVYAKGSLIGLTVLWLTGIGIIAAKYGLPILGNVTFDLKLLAAALLTGIMISANLHAARSRKAGTPPNPGKMKHFAIAGQASAITALILAVITFS